MSVKAKSQVSSGITGTVRDNTGLPLLGATISLLRQKDSLLIGTQSTSEAGNFVFENITAGSYTVRVTMAGRSNFRSEIIEYKSGTLIIQDIILKQEVKMLGSVEVNGSKKLVDVKAGKVVYNVENSIVSSGKSAYDILRQTPTITINQEDNLLIKGNSNINVMIDGRMTYLTNDQLTTMLKGMPAETIKSVEVLAVPPSQYDASGTGGMINIITNKMQKKGFAVNFSSGFTGGQYGSTVQSVLGNFADTRINIYGGYTYNSQNGYRYRTSYRIVDSTAYNKQSFDPFHANNNSYKIGMDYHLDRKQEIGFLYSGYNNSMNLTSTGPTQLLDLKNILDSVVRNNNTAFSPSVNNSFDVNYLLRLDTNDKSLSAELDYIHYNNNYYGTQGNQFFNPEGDSLQPFQQLRFQQPSIITIRSAKVDLVMPYRNIRYAAGLKYSSITTDNNFSFDSLVDNNFIYSESLSNYFIYSETIGAAYLSASKKWKTVSGNLGLRAELTHSLGNLITQNLKNANNYFDLFPYLTVNKKITRYLKVDFSFDRRINRPVYADLNPTKYFRDKYVYIQGNPFLKPEIGWNTSFSFTFLDKYLLSFTYNLTTDPMLTYAYQDSTNGQLRITTLNYSAKKQFDMLLSVPISIGRFLEMQNTIDLNHMDYDLQQPNAETFTVKMWTLDIASTSTFLIPGDFKGEWTVHYTSPSVDGIYVNKYYFAVQAGLKRSLLNKKLDALLSVSDIFKTHRDRGYSILPSVVTQYNHHSDSRLLTINLTYHLGGTLTQAKKINVEEQKRL